MKSGVELKLRDVTGKAEVWIDGKLASEKNDVMRSTIEQTEPSPST